MLAVHGWYFKVLDVVIGKQLIKDVEITFVFLLAHEARFLQEIIIHPGGHDLAADVEVNFHPLAKSTRVVVSQRLGVSKSF